jgi:hypothetical protein
MSTKSHIYETYGTLKKMSFCTKGYAEIYIQRPFFDDKNSIWYILGLKIQIVETCSNASSTHTNFYLKKKLKSRFLVEFQSLIFGQILAILGVLGKFCYIGSMPKDHLKS